jgi:hypothetical protein
MHGSISKILELAFKITMFKTFIPKYVFLIWFWSFCYFLYCCHLAFLGRHYVTAEKSPALWVLASICTHYFVLLWPDDGPSLGGRNLSLLNKRILKSVLVVIGDFLYCYDCRTNTMFHITFNVGLYKRRFWRYKRLAASQYRLCFWGVLGVNSIYYR